MSTRHSFRLLLSVLVLVSLSAVPTRAAPAADPRGFFGPDRRVVLDGRSAATAVVVQGDSKVVVAGGEFGDPYVVRLLRDGTPDLAFGPGGESSAAALDGEVAITSMIIDAKDRIVVSGSFGHAGGILRLLPDGQPDPSFDRDGLATPPELRARALDVFEQRPDGSYVVLAQTANGYSLVRLLEDGRRDVDFGPVDASLPDFYFSEPQLVAVLGNQPVVVTAVHCLPECGSDLLVAAYDADGRESPRFGGKPSVRLDYGVHDAPVAAAEHPGGELVVVLDGGAVVRITFDGRADRTWGTCGVAGLAAPAGHPGRVPQDVAVTPEVGTVVVGSAGSDLFAAGLRPDGVRHPGFGRNGEAVEDVGGADRLLAVAPGHGESVFAVGGTDGGALVAQYLSNPPSPFGTGYLLAAADGGTFAFDVQFEGSAGCLPLNHPVVGVALRPQLQGYWLVASDGGVFSFGDAWFQGSTGDMRLNRPVVGMAPTPSGNGYWLVASDGGVFDFGDASFYGSTGALTLNQPIAGMAATPSGEGYWLVASDGGIFSFGDASFYGSTGALTLNQPIVGMAATPSGDGYWLVASDGGIFAFGDASFHGSTGAMALNRPIVGMDSTPSAAGYWLVASDGGVFVFGDAPFHGSTGSLTLASPVVGIGARTT